MKQFAFLLLTLMLGYGFAQETTKLNFAAMIQDEMAVCGQTYEGLGAMESSLEFQDLRFYVSNILLINDAGEEIPFELTQDNMWQYQNVALLDFEDATGLCSQSGNSEMNSVVEGTAPVGDYVGLVFTLGVPFELNHSDVTTAPSPLNISSMWWNWQGGYKHLRIDLMSHSQMMDMQTSSGETNSESSEENAHGGAGAGLWPIHLGSTGCVSDARTVAPSTECSTPNTFEVRFDSFDFADDTIIADISSLLTNVDVSQSLELMPPGCMSGPQDPDCSVLFQNLGLTTANQAFFKLSQ